MVVWVVVALATFLPNIFLEWRSMFPRTAGRIAAAAQ